ncbi:MAG: YtxH domain-containing protein [Bacteroidales bacterium]
MSKGKGVLGTVAGLAIGATAGILLAPRKGSKTRKQIVEKGEGYVDKLKSKLDDFVDTTAEKFGSTKNDAENLAEKGKVKFNDAKKDIEADIKHAKS